MKLTRGLPVILATLSAAACEGPPFDQGQPEVEKIQQAATVDYTSPVAAPYGSLAVVGSNNGQRLVFWHSGTGSCTWHWLGTGGGFVNDINVRSGNALWADMRVLGAGQSFNINCSGGTFGPGLFPLGPIVQGGKSVSLHGTARADYFNCTGQGLGHLVNCFGYSGNDIMDNNGSPSVVLIGGNDNDKLRAVNLPGSAPASAMFGDDGDDCVSSSSSATFIDGGSGSSDVCTKAGGGCEIVTPTTCP